MKDITWYFPNGASITLKNVPETWDEAKEMSQMFDPYEEIELNAAPEEDDKDLETDPDDEDEDLEDEDDEFPEDLSNDDEDDDE